MISRSFRTGLLACCLGVLLPAVYVHGATISLIAFSTFALTDQDGIALPDGSIVEIVGITGPDPTQGGHVPFGDGFVWGSTQAGGTNTTPDIILATTIVDSTLTGLDGTFFVSTTYDDTVVNYIYIRFYDTDTPGGSNVAWGSSLTFDATSFFNVQFQNFTPTTDIPVTQTNNFVVIPEPGSFSLLAFFGFLLATFRYKWIKAWWKQSVEITG